MDLLEIDVLQLHILRIVAVARHVMDWENLWR